MMMTKERRTLERADPRESILDNDIVIRFSVTTGFIIAVLVFVLICFILVPATNGFYWW
jgi:fucose permease